MIDALLPLAIVDPASVLKSFFEATPMFVYMLVFGFMAIESSIIPFPSEVVVPPAAYLAAEANSDVSVILVVLFATAGAFIGACVNYYLALWIGRPIVYRFANSKLGHACLLDQQKVEYAEKYFDDHGVISTFIGRLIPAVRQLISIPAGLARMNIGKFTLFTCLGAMTWNVVLASLGYWLGSIVPREDLYDTVEKYNVYLTYAGIAIAAICVIVILYNAFKKHNPKESDK